MSTGCSPTAASGIRVTVVESGVIVASIPSGLPGRDGDTAEVAALVEQARAASEGVSTYAATALSAAAAAGGAAETAQQASRDAAWSQDQAARDRALASGFREDAVAAAGRAESAADRAQTAETSATSAAARAELIDARTVASAALDASGRLILTRTDGSTVDAGLARGGNGLDAYALAVQQGYGGTLTQWIASLKGADGAPGASSIAPDSRLIFGSGSPQGVHAAGVGVRFSCIDEGGWYGAKEWRKDTASGTTGWRVVDGDTGWRAFTPPQATIDNLHTGFASRFLVRRIAGRVEVQFALRLVAAAGWPTIWRVPLGYRGRGEFSTNLRVVMPGLASGMTNVSGTFEYNTHPPEHSINFSGGTGTGHDLITRGLTAGGSWACDDAWSAALFTSTTPS